MLSTSPSPPVRRVLTTLALLAVGSAWLFARGGTAAVPRRQMRHEIFYRVQTSDHAVALTFDDGPFPEYTPTVLQILREGRARATFFLVGSRAVANPSLVSEIAGDGNEIGNHTWSHPHLTWLLERDQQMEIARGKDALVRLGYPPSFFRPPWGLVSELGVRDATALGERTVLWSLSIDHEASVFGDDAVAEMLRRVRPGDIILAHDARPKLFGVLRDLLSGLRERGYDVLPVSELLASARR